MSRFWTGFSICLAIVVGSVNRSFVLTPDMGTPENFAVATRAQIYLNRIIGEPVSLPLAAGATVLGLLLLIVGYRLRRFGQIPSVLGWLLILFCWAPFIGIMAGMFAVFVVVIWIITGFGTHNPYYPWSGPAPAHGYFVTDEQLRARYSRLWQIIFFPHPHQHRKILLWSFVPTWAYAAFLGWAYFSDPIGMAVYPYRPDADSGTRSTPMMMVTSFLIPMIIACWLELLREKPDPKMNAHVADALSDVQKIQKHE